MTDRELMQQALEALEFFRDTAICQADTDVATEAIAALRERLAQPQRTHWEGCEEVHPECRKPERPPNCGTSYCSCIECVMEQPEQEPVAWVTGWHDGHCVIRAANPAAILPIGIALYTTPPRREWVGLTQEEIEELDDHTRRATIDNGTPVGWFAAELARAIEANLKEKNA